MDSFQSDCVAVVPHIYMLKKRQVKHGHNSMMIHIAYLIYVLNHIHIIDIFELKRF